MSKGYAPFCHSSSFRLRFFNPVFVLSVLIAVSIHECAHAYTAYRLGDSTAKHAGRMTLNPLAHLDLLGVLFFLFVGFGWAKPVPVDASRLHHPRRDAALVALAGPFSNFLLAFLCFFLLLIFTPHSMGGSALGLLSGQDGGSVVHALFLQVLASSLFVNLALMAFNLFPIAPLDGSKILGAFIPWQYELEYEHFMQHGSVILLFLLFFESFLPFPILSGWVYGISDTVLGVFKGVAGLL